MNEINYSTLSKVDYRNYVRTGQYEEPTEKIDILAINNDENTFLNGDGEFVEIVSSSKISDDLTVVNGEVGLVFNVEKRIYNMFDPSGGVTFSLTSNTFGIGATIKFLTLLTSDELSFPVDDDWIAVGDGYGDAGYYNVEIYYNGVFYEYKIELIKSLNEVGGLPEEPELK